MLSEKYWIDFHLGSTKILKGLEEFVDVGEDLEVDGLA
jgi:hypothetical protein